MKRLQGKIVSSKMEKSAVVIVERKQSHPIYKKIMTKKKRYLVDNEIGAKTGSLVQIEECRPKSKRKRFKIIKVVKK